MRNDDFEFGDRGAVERQPRQAQFRDFPQNAGKNEHSEVVMPTFSGKFASHSSNVPVLRNAFALRPAASRFAKRAVVLAGTLLCFGSLPPLSTAAPDNVIQFSREAIEVATVPLDTGLAGDEVVQEVVSHRVRSGETLWQLSRHYGVDVDTLASANNLDRSVKLRAGQVLYILRAQSRIHTVVRGETLNSISRRYGASVAEILQASPGVRANDLEVGQRLTIPASRSPIAAAPVAARPRLPVAPPPLAAVRRAAPAQAAPAPIQGNIKAPPTVSPELASRTLPYQVKSGDTLEGLARRYGISKQAIQRANPGTGLSSIQSGQRMRLPRMPGVLMHQDYSPGQNNQLALLTPPASQSLPHYPSGLIRPVTGPITSGYGWRWGRMHHGIDFGGPVGSPISAVMGGEVIFAGWDRGGYGNRVDIRHPNGMVTRYAHGHKIYVRRGQSVGQGDVIMTRGSTGRSTGPHLHFEIRRNNRSFNPLKFLA